MLTFNDHITYICKKSARQLAFLKRLGHLLTLQGKVAIFKSFISSNFNYCLLIWYFCSQCNTSKFEKVQQRALRLVYNDYIYSHADLIETAGAEYLHIKEWNKWPEKCSKLLITSCQLLFEKLIALKRSQYLLRNDKTAVIPRANITKYGLNSFAHKGARIWDSLPNVFLVNTNYREFSRLIQNWSGSTCKCIICRQWICDTGHMQSDFISGIVLCDMIMFFVYFRLVMRIGSQQSSKKLSMSYSRYDSGDIAVVGLEELFMHWNPNIIFPIHPSLLLPFSFKLISSFISPCSESPPMIPVSV